MNFYFKIEFNTGSWFLYKLQVKDSNFVKLEYRYYISEFHAMHVRKLIDITHCLKKVILVSILEG